MIRPPHAKLRRVARTAVCIVAVLALAVSVVLPAPAPPDTQAWHGDARFTEEGQSAALPAVTERPERLAEKYTRVIQLILPVIVLEHGPVVFGAVILPARDEKSLTSFFVYTQTTSSRL